MVAELLQCLLKKPLSVIGLLEVIFTVVRSICQSSLSSAGVYRV
jgi:hypothetical protein